MADKGMETRITIILANQKKYLRSRLHRRCDCVCLVTTYYDEKKNQQFRKGSYEYKKGYKCTYIMVKN